MCRLLRIDILLFYWPWTRALKEEWITKRRQSSEGKGGAYYLTWSPSRFGSVVGLTLDHPGEQSTTHDLAGILVHCSLVVTDGLGCDAEGNEDVICFFLWKWGSGPFLRRLLFSFRSDICPG